MEQTGIIIGGGIGGLVTALALNQQGIRSTIYEKAILLQEVGAGLVLSSNALFVFDQLGLLEALTTISWPLTKGLITDPNGRIVQKLDVQALTKQYGYGTLVVNRGKLQRLLLDSLNPDQIHTGKQLADLHDDGRQVHARFTDGSTADGSFLIGTDGIRSAVRTQLFGELPLHYSGQSCWRTIINYPIPVDGQSTSIEYWGRSAGLRVGLVPCGLNQLYAYITVATPANGHDVPGNIMPYLQSLGQHFPPNVSQILEAAEEGRIHRADLYDLPTLRTWSRGRCTLLGDAAHATTPNVGQGACQAIEDAFVVSACLALTTTKAEAFRQYESIRKEKADRIVKLSRQIGQVVNLPGWLKPLAFTAMRAMPKSASKQQFDGIYNMDYARKLAINASRSHPAPVE
ncbi:FAD-dependent monooxygenase [Spirosoma endbachense]|uniref:NAD(P)-binding protein n=1 Tax=Spirosoma endbachense TaxID=2666025 RepID=A0A6P1VRS4_9BACT|nr:FAD-dependent monooxygenase [Spirosoma endbachense]QHV94427.1 NAD(P)-binding protein [Spirosoma endbachense]